MTTSLSLTFDVPGRSLHCPMVTVGFAGCETLLIVDTGATSHVLTTEFARVAGLQLTPTSPGRDIAGDAVPSWSVGDVVVEMGGGSVALRDVVAIDGPEPFQDWGVGGFLSPQSLAVGASVLLDLATNRIEIVDGGSAMAPADLARRFDDHLVLEGARHVAGTIGIEVRVPPASPVIAFFDTGAASTEVAAAAVEVAVDRTTRTSGRGVGGSAVEAVPLKGQYLQIGAARIPVPDLAVRDEIPAPDDAAEGEIPLVMIGMDVLGGTVLAIPPPEQGPVWWLVPTSMLARPS